MEKERNNSKRLEAAEIFDDYIEKSKIDLNLQQTDEAIRYIEKNDLD